MLHLEAKNMHASYILGGVQLEGSVVEKDLGILVDHKLNNDMQCQAVVSKAKKVLSCIKIFFFLDQFFLINENDKIQSGYQSITQ